MRKAPHAQAQISQAAAELMTSREVAELLGIASATLCRWRARGDGPRWTKTGSWVRYRRVDVEAWLAG